MSDIRQGSSGRITFTLNDASGSPIPAAAIQTLTLALYVTVSGTVINSRDDQDVKGVNGGALVDGGGTIDLVAADNIMESPTATVEAHTALLKFTTANEAGSGELSFNVTRVRE